MSLKLRIGLNAVANYKRLDYEIWYALAEYVDNSTQSYFNNNEALDAAYAEEGVGLEVRIAYDRQGDKSVLRIGDNAMGMSYEELEHALQIAVPPDNPSGRCRYGMGMKTSSCWIGNKWTIKTKKLGETTEYLVEVDVDRLTEGNPDLKTTVTEGVDPSLHYTVIEISDHNREFKGRTIGKIKRFLRSMYRQDISAGVLSLYYGPEKLAWQSFEERLGSNRAGEVYKKEFAFEVYGKRVSGWAGILDPGARADAGFSILHNGRVVRGWPDSWRPERIYGLESNNLLNQRLIGEIHLDDFEVTHTKDNIQWYGDEEEALEKDLESQIDDLIKVASTPWKDQKDERGPSDVEQDIAISALKEELTSKEMIDQIEISVIPSPEAVSESMTRIAEPVKTSRTPTIRAQLDRLEIWVYVASDLSPNDPYVVTDTGKDDKVIVIINTRHPHMASVDGSVGTLNYWRHCIYDAIAEWQAMKLRGSLDSSTIKLLKDRLLRVPLLIQEHAESDETAEEQAAE